MTAMGVQAGAAEPGKGDDLDKQPQLSALEEALRAALGAVPHDQVLRCVVAALPPPVLIEHAARPHGGRVRKVSVSMPEELAEAVRARTGAGGFSRYVTDAVHEKVRLDLLDDLSAELEAEFGPIDEDGVRQAMRLWPDDEEEQ